MQHNTNVSLQLHHGLLYEQHIYIAVWVMLLECWLGFRKVPFLLNDIFALLSGLHQRNVTHFCNGGIFWFINFGMRPIPICDQKTFGRLCKVLVFLQNENQIYRVFCFRQLHLSIKPENRFSNQQFTCLIYTNQVTMLFYKAYIQVPP